MVSTTINFEKDNVQPPVFIAGAFTDWTPTEMTYETTETNGSVKNVFSYHADLEPGQYSYKFRLGPGDWWVLDEATPTANDEHGNVNNVLSVKAQESHTSTEPPIETIPDPPPRVLNTRDAYIMDDESNTQRMNGSADHEESIQPFPPPEEVVSNLINSHAVERPDVNLEVLRANNEKQVHFDEQTGKITASIVPARKDSVPDVAPPPYSISASGTVLEPGDEVQVAPVNEAAPQRQPAEPETIKAQSESKQKSLFARVFSGRGLIMVAAMVGVPVAVSYYLRR